MDKQAIVERVTWAIRQEHNIVSAFINRIDVANILTAAGHFDLLAERDALRKVVAAARKYIRCSGLYSESCYENLDQVLTDLDALGGGE